MYPISVFICTDHTQVLNVDFSWATASCMYSLDSVIINSHTLILMSETSPDLRLALYMYPFHYNQ